MIRFSTAIDNLDEILGGGFPEGSTVLIAGRPGTGKTILAHQILFKSATPEKKSVYFTTLSEPQVKVMAFQQQFDYFDMSKFQSSVIYRDLGDVLRKRGTSLVLHAINEVLMHYQPGLVVIDTLRSMADMIPSYMEYREFLIDISLRLATWGCTTLFIGEYSEEDINLRPESAIADGIIYLSGTEEKKQQKRFLRILKMRGTACVGGENLFRITKEGIDIFPRLKPNVSSQSYAQSGKVLSTGVDKLNKMMDGGIPSGSTTLVSGASGTGKTLLALHFAYSGLQNGEKAVYVSFEENPLQIVSGAKKLGLDLQPYIESEHFHLLYVSPIELDVDEHIYKIQKLVTETRATRLVIDSISSFEIGMIDKTKYTDHIWALTDFFKAQGVSVLLTHEMHDALRSELTKHGISFVADNLLLLRFIEVGFTMKRYLRVVKMRSTKHDNSLREILITSEGLSLGEPPVTPSLPGSMPGGADLCKT